MMPTRPMRRALPNPPIKQDNDSSHTLSGLSRLTSARGALHRKSSKESIQSHLTSLSNFSTHDAPSAIYKDREDISVSDFNYSDTLQKSIFSLRNESQSNESQSTVCVTPGPWVEPDRRSRCASAFLRVLILPYIHDRTLTRKYRLASGHMTTWTSRVSCDGCFLILYRFALISSHFQ
jgi:hypothetical protein